jgi:hypothetical protein
MKTAFAALFLSAMMPVPAADVPGLKTLAIGDAAPAFRLVGIDEETHTLDAYAKSPLFMVAFSATTAPPRRRSKGASRSW